MDQRKFLEEIKNINYYPTTKEIENIERKLESFYSFNEPIMICSSPLKSS